MSVAGKVLIELRKSHPYYWLLKKRYFRHARVDRTLTERPDLLDQLLAEGVVVLPGFFDRSVTDRIKGEIEDALQSVRDGSYEGEHPSFRFEDFGTYRLLEIDALSPSSREFFDHAVINGLAKAYVSKDVVSYQRMAELRPDPGQISSADQYHIDDWKHRFKAFLYLNDVSEDESPFVYWPTSHLPAGWRSHKEFEYQSVGKAGLYGNLTDTEAEDIKAKYGYEEKVCTGEAGTLILVDTRGVHRGTPLKKNARWLLANYFGLR